MKNKKLVNFSIKMELLLLITLLVQLYSYNYGQNWITGIVFWLTGLLMIGSIWAIGLMALPNLFDLKLIGEVTTLPKWKWHITILYIVVESIVAYMFFLLGREIFGFIVITYSLLMKYHIYLIRNKIKVSIESKKLNQQTKKPFIILNQIRTPDGTILKSTHVHDYQGHTDKNGEYYFTDGGDDYIRRSVNKEPYEDITIYSNASIEIIRQNFTWGTRGKNGDEPLRWILLCDMSNLHIENVIDYLSPYPKEVGRNIEIFQRELKYRDESGIIIEDS